MTHALRRDRAAAGAAALVILVIAVAVVAALAVVLAGFSAVPARTLSVYFYRVTEAGGSDAGPAAGVHVSIWDATTQSQVASGVSGSDGRVAFHALRASTLGFRYGGGAYVYVGQAVDLTNGDLSIQRGVLPCPSTSCSAPS